MSHPFRIPESELEFSFSRSSGPGGQNVNKVNSKVTLRWNPGLSRIFSEEQRQRLCTKLKLTEAGELVVSSERYRDQGRNKEDCLAKLRDRIEEALRVPRVRKKTKKPHSVRRKDQESKRRQSEKKCRRSFRY